ncbi:MAG: U32 family peptidase [Clostridia bacterium]|nr:U32 family peptidase [Clostridia bacterium]
MSKILVPLNNRARIKEFVEAGADEFYMGFYDNEWIDEFGDYSEINRMSGFKKYANPYNFKELIEIANEIKSYGNDIFVTINSASYSQKEIDKLLKYFVELKKVGVDGVIVSTPELTVLAKEYGLEPVASTMCGIFNEDIVSYYKKLGMNRMILPRDLSLDEIESIVKAHPDVSYEVFLMRNGCRFSDSHCLGLHREKGSMCGVLTRGLYRTDAIDGNFKTQHDYELNNTLYTTCFHGAAACGLCAIYRFSKLGISAYKIVGRSERPSDIIADVKMVKHNLEIAKNSSSEEEYLKKMKMPENAKDACKLGLSCYYPEVRF